VLVVEVAGVEPASSDIKTKGATCLALSLVSSPELQEAEFQERILDQSHPVRSRLNGTDHPAIDVFLTPQDWLKDGSL